MSPRARLRSWLLAGVLGASAATAHAQAPDGRADRESEAAQGRLPYRLSCGPCHGANLEGTEAGSALKGPQFMAKWSDHDALLKYIQTQMPPNGAGTLAPQAYAQITAYVLKNNEPPPPGDSVAQAAEAARKAKLAALSSVTDAMLMNPPDSDWLIWRRDYAQSGFSRLKQIDRTNVAGLRQAWGWTLTPGLNQMTPLIHEGVMFLASGNVVQALDAATGDLLWQYSRTLPALLDNGRTIRGPRALAIHEDRLFITTADKHLIALNTRTGALVWDTPIITEKNDSILSGSPIVVRGKVVFGVSGALIVPGGNYILGMDAATGKEVWRFHTVARPGQPGGDSWNGAPVNERYGGGVWTGASYDAKRNTLLIGVAQTYTTGTLLLPRPKKKGQTNDGLFMDSTLALDPDTGKLVWFYQHMNRDVWDQDWAFERTLATLTIGGRSRDVVMTAGKPAIFDVLDRSDGQYLFSKDVGLQNLIVAIDPKTGRKSTDPAMEPEWGVTKLICPGYGGARNWPATSFNPDTRILYVPLNESCGDFSWTKRSPEEVARGGTDLVYSTRARPNSDGKFGRIQAINMETGKVVWMRRERAQPASSMLATAGGLVFSGSTDRFFRAHDELTGDVLWEVRLNSAPRSSPVTYSIGGNQYVAVVTGPGSTGRNALTPEIDNPPASPTVFVFRLPEARRGGS